MFKLLTVLFIATTLLCSTPAIGKTPLTVEAKVRETTSLKTVTVTVYFYCPKAGGINCGPTGKTAFKNTPKPNYTIAVSRNLYKSGWKENKKIYIPGFGIGVIQDLMGAKIKGNAIDICVSSAKEAFKLGKRKNVTISLLD